MTMTRRALVRGSLGTGASGALMRAGRPSVAHGNATPEPGEPLSVDEVVRRLRGRPITSPLFPADQGPFTITDWIDPSDDDLTGTVGAFTVHAAAAAEDDTEGFVGAYMIHPTVRAAEARMVHQTAPDPAGQASTLFGKPFVSGRFSDGASLVGVVEGFVIVSAIGFRSTPDDLTPESSDHQEQDARALANLAGLLDHLRLVRTDPD
ncbi:MAG: hypothetical protein WBA46_17940 [Thermomicrobiales bacterium]